MKRWPFLIDGNVGDPHSKQNQRNFLKTKCFKSPYWTEPIALSAQFNALIFQFSTLIAQFNAHIAQFSALITQFNALSAQFSALIAQFSALTAQFSALSAQFTVFIAQFSALIFFGLFIC